VSADEWQQIAERGYGAWTRRDLDGLLAALAPEIVFRTAGMFPGLEDEYRGHEGMRRFWAQLQEPWESFAMEAVAIDPRGDAAVIDIHFHAVGRESGVEVQLDVFHLIRKRDGLVTELSSFSTRDAALAAL
jgi:ketosteroid isomerase-like protein